MKIFKWCLCGSIFHKTESLPTGTRSRSQAKETAEWHRPHQHTFVSLTTSCVEHPGAYTHTPTYTWDPKSSGSSKPSVTFRLLLHPPPALLSSAPSACHAGQKTPTCTLVGLWRDSNEGSRRNQRLLWLDSPSGWSMCGWVFRLSKGVIWTGQWGTKDHGAINGEMKLQQKKQRNKGAGHIPHHRQHEISRGWRGGRRGRTEKEVEDRQESGRTSLDMKLDRGW